MVEKTLQSDVDNDVIADHAAGRDEPGERRFPAYGQASLPASGRTPMHRLPDAERSMPQGHPGAFLALFLEPSDHLSQGGEARARDRAGFFTS